MRSGRGKLPRKILELSFYFSMLDLAIDRYEVFVAKLTGKRLKNIFVRE